MKKYKSIIVTIILIIIIAVILSQKTNFNEVLQEDSVEEVTEEIKLGFKTSLLLDSAHTYDVEVADLNNDGYPDIIAGNYNEQNVIYFNNHDGTFSKLPLDKKDYTKVVKAADMNNDGLMDLIIGNFNQPVYIYTNNDGAFFLSRQLEKSYTEDIAIADFNKDGYNDIVVGTNFKENIIYLNDQHGNFERNKWSEKIHITNLLVYDYNKDTYPDLIVGADFEPTTVYLNDGEGNFYPDKKFGEKEHNYDMALIDYDKDTNIDLIQANNNQDNYIWDKMETKLKAFNQGNTYSIAVGDLNNNGYDDVVVGNYNEPMAIYLNDKGTFLLSSQFGKYYVHDIELADINKDGKLDIIIAKDKQISEVLLG